MELNQIPAQIGSFVLKEKIGFGSFSSVYYANDLSTKLPVAVKVISKERIDASKLKREVELLKRLDHPFCVSFYEFLEDEKFYYIVMEYVEGRTVFKLINCKGALPEWLCRHIFCQLISALEYLHEEKKLVHRDLKAENIMVDKFGNIRLIDFGLSNQFSGTNNLLHTACGSPAYAPPEMFKGEPYTSTADLWSAGVVLYAMAAGKLPFEDQHVNKLVEKILTSEPDYPDSMDPQLVDLLHRMLMKDMNCRMSIKKIRAHPWFTKYHFAHIMNAEFGIVQGFRVHNEMNDDDISVLSKLDELGFDGKHLQDLARKDVYLPIVTPYRIVHRVTMTMKMAGMSATAEKSEIIQDQFEAQSLVQKPKPMSLLGHRESLPCGTRYTYHGPRYTAKYPPSIAMVADDSPVVAQSTSLAQSKCARAAQSHKVASHYRAVALSTLNKIGVSPQRRTRPRGFSFQTPPV